MLFRSPKVTDIFKEHSYEEMTKMLHNWLNPEAAAEETTSAPAKATSSNKSNIEESAPVAKVDDVASAFDSLFNK